MTKSRFERYAEARSSGVTSMIFDVLNQTDEASAEELAELEELGGEAAVVETVVEISIEQAIRFGYFLGMIDGRKDLLGQPGERFVSGENVHRAIAEIELVHGNAVGQCPTDEFIRKRVGLIVNIPIGLPLDTLKEVGSELR